MSRFVELLFVEEMRQAAVVQRFRGQCFMRWMEVKAVVGRRRVEKMERRVRECIVFD
jgi:hypothetical protein